MTGQQFGHYEVESRLGSGGMGVVYLARDIRLERRVAIKVLADGRVADELARARFRREAQALSRLNHPNIATIYDFDQQDGHDFLVMEYIEGRSLRDVGPEPLAPTDLVRLGTQLAEALVAAHGAGVVHLDLKPGNMMLTADGRLKVLDFGIARLHAPDIGDGSTYTGPVDTTTLPNAAGTPPYMAPEQVAAGPVDPRTDIYAAGATLYELATGHRVFDKPRGAGLNEAILRDKPDPPSQLNPGISAALEDALMKALEKQPVRRQQTALELLQDFQKAADSSTAAVRPHRRWTRREILLTAAATVAAVAVTGYALWPTPVRVTFHARDFVLVGDLDNTTSDPLLSRTVQQALSISLQQSTFVNLVARDRVVDALARMKRPATAALDEPTGRDVCQRESVPALISGSVTRSGSRTRIAVRVIEAGSGGLLYIGTAEYQKPEELFGRLDDLARDLREHLGESLDAIASSSQPLQKVTTESLEALRQYSKSFDARAMGQVDAVEAPLLAALQLDPEFAMAHLKLADYYAGVGGDAAKAQPEIDAAFRLRDRVTAREKYFIEAQYFQSHDNFEESRNSLKVLTALYPDDPEAHYELALVHYALEELKPGIAELRRAIALHPHAARAHGTLALLLARDNRPREAIDASRVALALGIESPYLYWARGLALVGTEQIPDARADFDTLASSPGFYFYLGRLQQARLSLYAGDFKDAAARLTSLVAVARAGGERAFELTARVQLARTALQSGDRVLVRAQSNAIDALTANDHASPIELHDSGAVALLAGDRSLAARQLARLEALESSNQRTLVRATRLLLAGDLAYYDHHPADAARLQDEALRLMPLHLYSRARAEAREAIGDWSGAAAAWRSLVDARGQIIQDGFPPDLAEAQARLARADARLKLADNRKDD
jgi:serine/threonine protein kinase